MMPPAPGNTNTAPELTILLVRPGATVFDDQGRIKGDLDLPLSPNGVRQVAQLVDSIPNQRFDWIFASPCGSARQTAEALGRRTRARVQVDDDLRNVDLGLWEGKRSEELRQTQPRVYQIWDDHPEAVTPPGGETIRSADERVARFLKRLLRGFKSGTVAIVVAEPLASLIRSQLMAQPIRNVWDADKRIADWELIACEPRPTDAGGKRHAAPTRRLS